MRYSCLACSNLSLTSLSDCAQEERFEDAAQLQHQISHEMTHNQQLRLVVAMESALADQRYEEAATLRDEFRRLQQHTAVEGAPASQVQGGSS